MNKNEILEVYVTRASATVSVLPRYCRDACAIKHHRRLWRISMSAKRDIWVLYSVIDPGASVFDWNVVVIDVFNGAAVASCRWQVEQP